MGEIQRKKIVENVVFAIVIFCVAYGGSQLFYTLNSAESKIVEQSMNLSDSLAVSNDQLIVLGTTWCHACKKTKELLDKHELPYRFVDIENTAEKDKHLLTHIKGNIPVLLMADVKIIGYAENIILKAAVRNIGELHYGLPENAVLIE